MTYNTLSAETRKATVTALQPLLASSLHLARTAKHAHWNVTGPNFIAVHRLLDEVYEAAEDWGDMIAERIRGMSGTAEGMVEEITENSRLKFPTAGIEKADEYIEMIAGALGILSKLYRAQVKTLNEADPATSNMLQDLSGKADQYIYLLESHLGS